MYGVTDAIAIEASGAHPKRREGTAHVRGWQNLVRRSDSPTGGTMSQPLLPALVGFFEGARADVAEALQASGMATTRQQVATAVELQGDHSWRSSDVVLPISVFHGFSGAELWRRLGISATPESLALADALVDEYGGSCQYWQMSNELGQVRLDAPPKAFADAPALWAEKNLIFPAMRQHLATVSDLAEESLSNATTIAQELLEFVEGETLGLVAVLPLAGFALDSEDIDLHEVSLRRLRPEESGLGLEFMRQLEDLPGSPISYSIDIEEIDTHLLQVRIQVPKMGQPEMDRSLERVVLGLQLLDVDLSSKPRYSILTSPAWIPSGRLHRRISTLNRLPPGPRPAATPELFADALELAQRIPDGAIQSPSNAQELAIHRFSQGVVRNSEVDSLIDLTVALEALLNPRDEATEVRLRFSLHGAHFIARDKAARARTFKDLRDIYDMRSALVHGSRRYPDLASVKGAASMGRSFAAAGLRRALVEGWPTSTDFAEMYL